MNRRAALILLGLLLSIPATYLIDRSSSKGCNDNLNTDKTISTPSGDLSVSISEREEEKTRGLGGLSCIPPNQGMLFVFNQPSRICMWMKDMRFPIDIVWLDETGRVKLVKEKVEPRTYPESFCNENSSYVLELAAGQANSRGIKEGATISL